MMHNAALINETIQADSKAFGLAAGETTHSWEEMRSNVQNHIKGLNFKYRVNLRENAVTYLNKLGKFKDNHTVEVTDKKGNVSENFYLYDLRNHHCKRTVHLSSIY